MKDNPFKILPWGMAAFLSLAIPWICGPGAFAQSSKETKGLHFQVPEDWPVEKRGGVVAPIPTEEYVSIRFKAVEEKFLGLEKTWSEKLAGVQSELKTTIKEMKTEMVKARMSTESSDAPAEGASTDFLSSIQSIQDEVGRLDRKITNKVAEMQAQLETLSRQISTFEDTIRNLQTQIYKIEEKVDYMGGR